MDYYSAYFAVIFSLFAIVIKLISEVYHYESRSVMYATVSIPFAAFYLYHTYYLHFVHFDYGYNMKVNVITGEYICCVLLSSLLTSQLYLFIFLRLGLLSTVCWLTWCFMHRRHRRKHVWMCFASLMGVNLCLFLELLDFPPIAFTFDAHSL